MWKSDFWNEKLISKPIHTGSFQTRTQLNDLSFQLTFSCYLLAFYQRTLIIFLRPTEASKSHHCSHLVISLFDLIGVVLLLFLLELLSFFCSLGGLLQLRLEIVRLVFLLFSFPLVFVEAVSDLVKRATLDLHAHAEVPLMLLAIDVVEEVDGIFDNTVAHVAETKTRQD